jgi:NADPH:quinone reductase-like Zn-dependent oxidoreductase
MTATATATRMRAVVCHRPTRPGALRVEEFDRPVVGDGEVLVRVHASSANPLDMFHLSPVSYVQRGFKPAIVGTDVAGVVEEVGRNVSVFKPGDELFGAARGAFAEYVSVSPDKGGVVRKPAGVSFADAGTLAVAASTALQALRDHGRMESGKRVLVNGASGGVGTFAVQIAKVLGGDVTAVCSKRNVDMVRSIGADSVVDYTQEDFALRGERYDLIVDVAGSHPLGECMRLLNGGGAFVCVGASATQHGKGGSWRALARLARIRLASSRKDDRTVAIFIAKLRKEDLEFLGDLVANGRVKPVIERTFDLAGAAEALARIDEGHLQGKLAIAVVA